MIREAISQLLDNQSLSTEQAEAVMDQIMSGEATPAQIAGFLVALRVKGFTLTLRNNEADHIEVEVNG